MSEHFIQKFAVLGIAAAMIPIILMIDKLWFFNDIIHRNLYYIGLGAYRLCDHTFSDAVDKLFGVMEWSLRKCDYYEELEKDG